MIVDLIKDQRDSLMIPEAALQPENNLQYVFVVGADNVANRVQVTIGRRRTGFVEILDGLHDGDLVIKEGTQDLRSGTRVTIANADALKKPPALGPEAVNQPG